MDEKLNRFVSDLKDAAGANLRSVILYGSAATGEFHHKHSDINLLCLFEKLDAATLSRINPLVRAWTKRGHPAPLVFAAGELARAADIFAIELIDIEASHKVLQGEDLLSAIEVPMTLHHLQVERELRQGMVRLRQQYLSSDGRRDAVLALLTQSVSSFAALFRHAAIALGAPLSGLEQMIPKRAAVDRLAAIVGFRAVPFHTVLDLREGKIKAKEIDVDGLFREYLESVSEVINVVDQRLDGRR